MPLALNDGATYVTVDALILTILEGKMHVLLSPRTAPPYAGQWALPGRFIGTAESAEDAVSALIGEMTPLLSPYTEQLYTFTDVGRDPRGRVISLSYLVIIPQREIGDLTRVSPLRPWRPEQTPGGIVFTSGEDRLDASALAFDHAEIIETGLRRLRGKIEYTEIGFRFLNDVSAFTLSDLKAVYEAILGTTLDKSNFRRFILNRFEATGQLKPSAEEAPRKRGRPAVTYQFTYRREDNT
ncbi:MAG: NUDIX hydrolase [Clostridia bacterium]|nr:NUDIX hydrolase [Clostridia bacterium]